MSLKVGIVGAHAHLLVPALQQYPHVLIDEGLLPKDLLRCDISHLVSFGYRHIVPEAVLDHFGGRVFNIHISLLPWNRGSDPNFWSWFDGTPKGVSLHKMTRNLDSGPLIAQAEVEFVAADTLRSSYQKLLEAGVLLFRDHLGSLMRSDFKNTVVLGSGSYHSKRDFWEVEYVLESGWDTPCATVEEWGLELRQRKRGNFT